MKLSGGVVRCVALLGLLLANPSAFSASISVQLLNQAGQPLANSAVYAEPVSGQTPPKSLKTVEIEQKNKTFFPLVTVIQSGTSISFPNNDTVRHHVYSFSPAKSFELKLYSGTPGSPVLFDKAGTVVVGCNIHDRMIAYIHIVDTPYFAKTDASGQAKLDGLMPGKYRLKAWHFNLPTGEAIPEQSINVSSSDSSASFTFNIKANTGTN
ncbi:MAG: methylamine utilization protein [Burkholderiaceae bacterium]